MIEQCHLCNGLLVRESRKTTPSYNGKEVTADQPGLWCVECGELILNSSDLAATRKEINESLGICDS